MCSFPHTQITLRLAPCSSEGENCFGLKPEYLTADNAYGSAESLGFGQTEEDHAALRSSTSPLDGTFSRADFAFDF